MKESPRAVFVLICTTHESGLAHTASSILPARVTEQAHRRRAVTHMKTNAAGRGALACSWS